MQGTGRGDHRKLIHEGPAQQPTRKAFREKQEGGRQGMTKLRSQAWHGVAHPREVSKGMAFRHQSEASYKYLGASQEGDARPES